MKFKIYFDKVSLHFCGFSTILSFCMACCCYSHPISLGKGVPIIGPAIFNFEHLQPVNLIYQPLAVVQNSLPAKEGVNFDGPDPGLNANFIRGAGCPDGRGKETSGVCREIIDPNYGPNPFSAIIPPTFKGSLNFYMGFKVGNSRPQKRRFPIYLSGSGGPHRIRSPHRLSRPVLSNNNSANKNDNDNEEEDD